MKKIAIQYSIVQLAPYPDREEVVNVGIVCFCPEKSDFYFKLLPINKKSRVTNFFKNLPKLLIKKTLLLLEEEFLRIKEFGLETGKVELLFGELVRPRESLVQYTTVRAKLVDDIEKTLNVLFNDLVEFGSNTTKTNHDEKLKKRFGSFLRELNLSSAYKEKHLESERYGFDVTMPFFNDSTLHSVKPISFIGQKNESALIQHADNWRMKIENLIRAEMLLPQSHLVTYEKPFEQNFCAAFDFAMEGLDKLGIQSAEIGSQELESIITRA
ncbi:MAG: DUF3037 domain-containing protein [Epsilonproteobacteria bacterium]|nr:DUF3037 domain-containing protein [Campylobacterota bacterium]